VPPVLSMKVLGGVETRASSSVRQWEPRVDVYDVYVTPDKFERNRLNVEVVYVIKRTNDRRNLGRREIELRHPDRIENQSHGIVLGAKDGGVADPRKPFDVIENLKQGII